MMKKSLPHALILIACGAAFAGPPDGLKIFERLDSLNAGFGDQVSEVRMVLKSPAGPASERNFSLKTLESRKNGDRILLVFKDPLDIKGTALLTHDKKAGANDVWIYLPGFHRVKRIADNNRASPFVGSEFSYEDIDGLNLQVGKFRYKYLKDEILDGTACRVVERSATGMVSAYARQVAWIDSSGRKVMKLEAYRGDGSLAKVISFKSYSQYPGGYWRPAEITAENRDNGRTTTLFLSDYKFRNGFNERLFNENTLGQ